MSRQFTEDFKSKQLDYFADHKPVLDNELLSSSAHNRTNNNIFNSGKRQLYYNLFSNDTANRLGLMRFTPDVNNNIPAYFKVTARTLPAAFLPTDGDGYVEIYDTPDAEAIGMAGTGPIASTIMGATYDSGAIDALGYPFKLLLCSYDKANTGNPLTAEAIYMVITCNIPNKVGENVSILLKHDGDLAADEFDVVKGNKLTVELTGSDIPGIATSGYYDIYTNFVITFNKTATTLSQLAAALNSITIEGSAPYFAADFSMSTDPFPTTAIIGGTILADPADEYTIQFERTSQYFSFVTGFKDFFDAYLHDTAIPYALTAYNAPSGEAPYFKHTGILGFYANKNYGGSVTADGLEYDPIYANNRNIGVIAVNSPVGFLSDTRMNDNDETSYNLTINQRFYKVDLPNYQNNAIQFNFYPMMIIERSCLRFMNGLSIKLADIIKFGSDGVNIDANSTGSGTVLESNVLFDLNTLNEGSNADTYLQALARYKETIRRDTGSVPASFPTTLTSGGSALQVLSELLGKDADFGLGLLDGDYLVVDKGYGAHITDDSVNPGTNRYSSLEDAIIRTYTDPEKSTIIVRYNAAASDPTEFNILVENLINATTAITPLVVSGTATYANIVNSINFIFLGFPVNITPIVNLVLNSELIDILYDSYDYFGIKFNSCKFSRINSGPVATPEYTGRDITINLNGYALAVGPTYHFKLFFKDCLTYGASLNITSEYFQTIGVPTNRCWLEIENQNGVSIDTTNLTSWDVLNIKGSINSETIRCNHLVLQNLRSDSAKLDIVYCYNISVYNSDNSKIRVNDLFITEVGSDKGLAVCEWVTPYSEASTPSWNGDYTRSYIGFKTIRNIDIVIDDVRISHDPASVKPYGDPALGTVALMSIIGIKDIMRSCSLTINKFSTYDIAFNGLNGLKVVKVWVTNSASSDLSYNTLKINGIDDLLSSDGISTYPIFATTGGEYYTAYSALFDFYGTFDFIADWVAAGYDVEQIRGNFFRDSKIELSGTLINFFNEESVLGPGVDITSLDPTDPTNYATIETTLQNWYTSIAPYPAVFMFGLLNSSVKLIGKYHLSMAKPWGPTGDPTDGLWGKVPTLFSGMYMCDLAADEVMFSSGGVIYDSLDDYIDYCATTLTSDAAFMAWAAMSLYSFGSPIFGVYNSKVDIKRLHACSNNLFFSTCNDVDFRVSDSASLSFPELPSYYATLMAGMNGCTFDMNNKNALLVQHLILSDLNAAALTNINLRGCTFTDFMILAYIDKPLVTPHSYHQTSTVANIIATGCRFTTMPSITASWISRFGKNCSFYGEIGVANSLYALARPAGSNMYSDMSFEIFIP